MKKIVFFSLFVAGLLTASCNKPENTVTEGLPVDLVVGINGDAATKATGVVTNSTDSEAKVNTLQVFVFNGNALDGYGTSTGSLSAQVRCSSGEREIWAVVNGEDLKAVTTKAQLMEQVAHIYPNTVANFTMAGSTTTTLTVENTDPVEVKVARLVSRVVIRGVKNALENAVQAADFKIDAIYLTNIAGDVDFGKTATYEVADWYNKQGFEPANNLGQVSYDAVDVVVPANGTHSVAHFFYSMPNRFAPAVGGSWSPRAAKLVVKATICGTEFMYPVTLPVMESNKSYEINLLTLTRSGNPGGGDDDDEKPITGIDMSTVTVDVLPWTVVLVGDTDGNITI